MSSRPTFTDIDDYIASAAPEARAILEKVRRLVHRKVPAATETISYQLPAFRKGRVFFYFAAFKHHIGIYPPVTDDAALIAELKPYRGDKGNLKFPLTAPMPYDLIGRVAEALARQYAKETD